jgi:hypothetical protein
MYSALFMQNEPNSQVVPGWDAEGMAMLEAGAQSSATHRNLDLGFWIWDLRLCQKLARMTCGMGRAEVMTLARAFTICRRKSDHGPGPVKPKRSR